MDNALIIDLVLAAVLAVFALLGARKGLIRSLMALFLLAFAAKVDDWKKSFVIAGITEAIMLVLFVVYDFLIIREFGVVGVTLLMQLLQGVVCAVLGAVLLRYMPVMQPDKMLEIRRPVD